MTDIAIDSLESLTILSRIGRSTWEDPDFDQLRRMHNTVKRMSIDYFTRGNGVTRRIQSSADDGAPDEARIDRLVAGILLSRFRDPLGYPDPTAWSPLADVIIGTFGAQWARSTDQRFADMPSPDSSSAAAFNEDIRALTLSAPCAETHPLFAFVASAANFEALAGVLAAENLCDLNFLNILAQLIPGMDETPAEELARNVWDEMGAGHAVRFHRSLRLDMMRHVGLDTSDVDNLARYLPEEIEHFNAYALSGGIRRYSLRLVGMMYATEFLVPHQLSAVVAGWRRVGLPESRFEYLLSHVEGDVEHARGWADHVIAPVISRNPGAGREIFLGVCLHLDILTRLYDKILTQLGGLEGQLRT
jgi:pyrroloquinoline quinone (PQQ) biosynthesis protein C